MQAPNVLNPHFVDGTNQAVDYTYDAAGRLIQDHNRGAIFDYHLVSKPSLIRHEIAVYLGNGSANLYLTSCSTPDTQRTISSASA